MKLFNKQQNTQAGFTLIEMLVVAPIVILTIGAFLTVIINMTGDVIASRAQNNLSYNVQDALNRIESDVKQSSSFLSQDSFDPVNQQGLNDTTTRYTNVGSSVGTALILNMVATTGNPVSTSTSYVYLKNSPNDCTNPQQNKPFTYDVVYFMKKEGTDNVLYRRTIMPQNYNDTTNTVCATPYQQPSCTPSYMDTASPAAICKTKDVELVRANDQTLKFFVQYFNNESATTENLTASSTSTNVSDRNIALKSATTVGVSIDAQQTSAGRTIQRSGVLRVSRLDGNAAGAGTIAADTSPVAPNIAASNTEPTYATFNWNKVTGATGYTVDYQINGGAWVNGFTNKNTTTFTVNNSTHNDVVNARVVALNATGSSSQSLASITIPLFISPALQNGWSNYNGGYSNAGYTKTPDGYVIIRGLIDDTGTPGNPETLFTLPDGYRPDTTMTYQAESNGDGSSIYVNTDGTVQAATNVSGAWLSLSDVKFLASTSPHSWTNLSMSNGWVNRGNANDPPLSYTKDAIGRVFVRGAISSGTASDGTLINGSLPPLSTYSHIAVRSGGPGNNLVGVNNSSTASSLVAKGTAIGSAYFPIFAYLPNAYTGTWYSVGASGQPAFQTSWANYGGIYNTAQFTKSSDNIVTLRGLIKSGSTGTIYQLPSGFRPSGRQIFAAACSGGPNCRIDILPDGTVNANTGVSSTWTSLDRVSFYADGS